MYQDEINKQTKEKYELATAVYLSGHGLDWVDSRDVAEQLYDDNYRKVTTCKDCVYSYFNPSSERYSCQRQYPRRSVEETDFCNYAKKEADN